MQRLCSFMLAAAVLGLPALVGSAPTWAAAPVALIDNATLGYYNNQLGTVLDGSQAQFSCANGVCGDPVLNPAPEPDLSPASSISGGWLSGNPIPLNANWSGPQAVPTAWPANTETAVIYEIDGGAGGIRNVTASLGVDNGIFVWVNGVYQFGALAPGGAFPGEYVVNLGDFSPGTTFLQILLEDHGGATGYSIQVVGEPNSPPDCSRVVPSKASLWPPDHTLRAVTLSGESDPDGGSVALSITGVTQDEPVNGTGDGDTSPDAELGPASNEVQLRAERSGTGDGRVYSLAFTVTDGESSCSGVAFVRVDHDRRPGGAAVNSGLIFDSLVG
jgi:hypothetical protein